MLTPNTEKPTAQQCPLLHRSWSGNFQGPLLRNSTKKCRSFVLCWSIASTTAISLPVSMSSLMHRCVESALLHHWICCKLQEERRRRSHAEYYAQLYFRNSALLLSVMGVWPQVRARSCVRGPKDGILTVMDKLFCQQQARGMTIKSQNVISHDDIYKLPHSF